MKKSTLITILTFTMVLSSFAQESFKTVFKKAEELLMEEKYALALKEYLKLDEMEKGNANVNFKIGFCYLSTTAQKLKSLPYLIEASKNVSEKYEFGSHKEKAAPTSVYYYLAQAYHMNYKFEDAITNYTKYRGMIDDKNIADKGDCDYNIQACKNAMEIVKNPKRVKIDNLTDSVNTDYPDFSPVVSLDEKTIMFTSRRTGGASDQIDEAANFPYEDIYTATKRPDGKWGKAKLMGATINSPGHEATINFSADGKKLLIYRDVAGNGEIFLSTLTGTEWSSPEPMGADINTGAWETHACFTADNKILYFISDRSGGEGGRDIYKTTKNEKGEWGKVENLGKTINTQYDEDGIFIHPDGKQIFFSSKGHNTMGGFDIFTSTQKDDGTWTTPENIGHPINTPDDDLFYVSTADGKRGYFSSARQDGYGEKDIYMITYLDEVEKDLAVMIGNFKDCEVAINEINVIDTKTGEMHTYSANEVTGKFSFALPAGTSYKISYKLGDKEIFTEELQVNTGKGYQEFTREIPCTQVVVAEECTPKNSYYELFHDYNIKGIDLQSAEFKRFLEPLMECLKSTSTIEVNIESSASHVPTATFKTNELLTKARAEEARLKIIEGLTKAGISAKSIKFVEVKTLVQGPEYKGDYVENKATYSKYQYIKVKAITVNK